MIYSSSLNDYVSPLVLDTSVLINLHACGYGAQILAAIPNDFVVPDIVAGELEHQTSHRNGEHAFLNALLVDRVATLTTLTDSEFELFQTLTSTSPSLGDGEAATIAVAAIRCLLPMIDERRGRARAEILMKAKSPGWSLDLFCHPAAASALGEEFAADALYLALRDGRMRIPAESTDSVIAMIGMERSRECTCLPGYKERFVSTSKSSK